MKEEEMSKSEALNPSNIEELVEYIESLVNQPQSYGTCVYAMSMASVATFNYVADKLGVTGFQASCADMDFLKRIRRLEHGFRITDYKNLLFPQYYYDADAFPTARQLLEKNLERLQEVARGFIEEEKDHMVHTDVLKHWEWIVSLPLQTSEKTEAPQ